MERKRERACEGRRVPVTLPGSPVKAGQGDKGTGGRRKEVAVSVSACSS